MPLKISDGRQDSLWAVQTINFNDLTSGVATAVINLPIGAVVVGGAIITATAFNSATSDTLSLGDSASATRYASAANIHATGRTALTLTGYKALTTTRQMLATWTGVGAAPTAGSVDVQVEYLVTDRAEWTQD